MTRLMEFVETYNRTQRQPGEPPMTIRRLAGASGLVERTVYRHVRGETTMNLAQAVAYARALRCRVEDLVDGGEAAA